MHSITLNQNWKFVRVTLDPPQEGPCRKGKEPIYVVKYGQFEPRNDEETDQQRRRRRQNTFAPELPQGFAAQHGGLAALRNRMKTLA